jgi:PAS domain S-box-containing protein
VSADGNTHEPSGQLSLELLAQPAWIAGRDGSIRFFNRHWYELTGTSFEEVAESKWHSLIAAEMRSAVVETWRASLHEGVPFRMTFPLRHHDGEHRWLVANATPVRDATGEIDHWIGICTDVDDQKKDQGKLQREVAKREDLLAIVSHDLRNPLNTILMATAQMESLARGEEANPRITRCTGIITRSVDQMNRLVGDLLDFARLESGGALAVDLEVHDAVPLVERLVEAREPMLKSRRLTMRTTFAERPLFVSCDADRLTQILDNLVGNAIKFTPEGGAITVIVERSADRNIVFSVSDTGVGIQEDHLPHIFQPYWQGQTEKKRGAGLGLAIVKGIVEAHHGRVWVSSRPGHGTTFFFSIRAADGTPTGERTSP